MSANVHEHTLVKYGTQFRQLCDPIFQSSPINYIGLAKLYLNGKRSYLITDPKWGEILLKNNYHLAGTEDALVTGPESSCHYWFASSMFSLNDKTQNLLQECIANNYGNGMTLVERGKDFVEFIHICAKSGYEKVDPYLINNIDLIWKYVLYLREALFKDKILTNAYNKQYYYNVDLVNSAYNTECISSLKVKKYCLGGEFEKIYFTKREMSCLILTYRHLNAKQIAQQLNLSKRTVENYLDNIKFKSFCRNKTELIYKLSKNNSFKSLNKILPIS